jgi:hypothetical protein
VRGRIGGRERDQERREGNGEWLGHLAGSGQGDAANDRIVRRGS